MNESAVGPTVSNRPRTRVVLAIVMFVVIAASAIAAILGMPVWIHVVLCAAPWVFVLGQRFGGALSLASTSLAVLTATLLYLMALHFFAWPMFGLYVVLCAIAGLAGGAYLTLGSRQLWKPTVGSWWTLGASLFGGISWLVVLIWAGYRPTGAPIAWAANGDSFNYLIFAQRFIDDQAIPLGPTAIPVPLPAGYLALLTESGQSATPEAALLQHGYLALESFWALLIVFTGVSLGLAVRSVLPRKHGAVAVVVTGGASLLVQAWFITGYPIEYGFLNALLVIPALLFCWVAYMAAERFPVVALFTLMLGASLVIAVWSPLVVFPIALGCAVLIGEKSIFKRMSRSAIAVLAVGAAQFLLVAGLLTLPPLLAQGEALTFPGAVRSLPPSLILVLASALIALTLAARDSVPSSTFRGSVAVVIAVALGLGVLLYLRRGEATVWGYYALKFAWLSCAIMAVIALGVLAAALVNRRTGRLATIARLTVIVVGTFAVANLVPFVPNDGYPSPGYRVLKGDIYGHGDAVFDQVFQRSDPDRPEVLWRSGHPDEAMIDYWLLAYRALSDPSRLDLGGMAYYHDETDVQSLCRTVALMGDGTLVTTADPALEGEMRSVCPDTTAEFHVLDDRLVPSGW